MGKRLAVFAYGLVSYLVFFLTFVYAVGFIGNLYVPKSIDSATRMSFWAALFIDALLLLMFPVQHSVMARPAFKEVPVGWTIALKSDTRAACLEFINQNWKDMRPKSLIDRMEKQAEGKKPN